MSGAEQDVVVTGVGVVSAGTVGAQALFERLFKEESLIRANPALQSLGFINPYCVYIDDTTWGELDSLLGEVNAEWGPQTKLALASAQLALNQSGVSLSADRAAVFVASNKYTFDERVIQQLVRAHEAQDDCINLDAFLAFDETDESQYFCKQQDQAGLALSRRLGLPAHFASRGEACAAGTIVIGSAMQQIRAGLLDVAIVGACEAMCNFTPLVAFNGIGALASGDKFLGSAMSRPFDKERYGFVMGEGSAFMVLESREHAERRAAQPLARLSGFASLLEAHHITASDSTGGEYARCMQAALADAGVTADDIDHVNAHGTSTPVNDAAEARALRLVFGERVASLPVTANKSALGHSLANSGAVEAVLSVLSLQQQILLPTLNYAQPDEDTMGLDVVTKPRKSAVRRILSNSFGFGGVNACLVLEAA